MTPKVPSSLSEVSRDATKPKTMIAEKENDFWEDDEKVLHEVIEEQL